MPEAPPAVGSAIVAQSVGEELDPQVSVNNVSLFREASEGLMSAEVFGQCNANYERINFSFFPTLIKLYRIIDASKPPLISIFF